MFASCLSRCAVFFAAFGLTLMIAVLAVLAQPAPAPEPIPLPVQAFGHDHPGCLEWSDACVVCQRDDAGAAHCSTVAIACVPEAVFCRREKP